MSFSLKTFENPALGPKHNTHRQILPWQKESYSEFWLPDSDFGEHYNYDGATMSSAFHGTSCLHALSLLKSYSQSFHGFISQGSEISQREH